MVWVTVRVCCQSFSQSHSLHFLFQLPINASQWGYCAHCQAGRCVCVRVCIVVAGSRQPWGVFEQGRSTEALFILQAVKLNDRAPIFSFNLSLCLSVTLSWTPNLRNVLKGFLQVWHKCSLELTCELIRSFRPRETHFLGKLQESTNSRGKFFSNL